MIGTRVVTDFPLCDQEILLRHLHKTAWRLREQVQGNGNGYGNGKAATQPTRRMPRMSKLPEEFADLERFTDWCLPTEEERYAKRLDLDDGRDAGVLRRRHGAPRGRHGLRRRAVPARAGCPTTPRRWCI